VEIIVVAISLIVSFIIEWKVAKITVNVVSSLAALLFVLLVENLIGAYLVTVIPVFNHWGLLIGAILGTLFGIFTEALRLDT
jgi:hypothetical protein